MAVCSLRGIAALYARGEAMASRAGEGAASGNKFFDLIRCVGGNLADIYYICGE